MASATQGNNLYKWISPRGYDLALFVLANIAIAYDSWSLLSQADGITDALTPDHIVILLGVIGLGLVALHAWRSARVDSLHAILIGLFAGSIYFVRVYGFALTDPTWVTWLLHADWGAHYGGWAMYRKAPWTWPPGADPALMYPMGTSIVYGDSLPLFAMPLKLIQQWLPDPFQYSGIWLVSCCLLQGVFAALLMRLRTASLTIVLIGAEFFLYAPVFISRTGHITLLAQWLVLASIWLYFRETGQRTLIAEARPWWTLAAISALVMPYLAAMTFAIQCAYWMRRVTVEHERTFKQVRTAVIVSVSIMLSLWILSGVFIIHYADGSGGVAYGFYSSNLLGLINPAGVSRIMPPLPMGEGQYEGFCYLGFGILSLLAVLLVDMVLRRQPVTLARHWPLIVVASAATLYAVSTVVMFGSYKLLDLPIRSPLLSTFRSSGRFIWILYYLIVAGTLWGIARRLRPEIAAVLLLAAFAAQSWELRWSHVYPAQLRTGAVWPSEKLLGDDGWDRLAEGRQHLTLVPPVMCGVEPGWSYLSFLMLAAKHAMTLNSGYVSRWDPKASARYCQKLVTELDAGQRSPDDLYVVSDEWLERISRSEHPVNCETLDGLHACVVADKK